MEEVFKLVVNQEGKRVSLYMPIPYQQEYGTDIVTLPLPHTPGLMAFASEEAAREGIKPEMKHPVHHVELWRALTSGILDVPVPFMMPNTSLFPFQFDEYWQGPASFPYLNLLVVPAGSVWCADLCLLEYIPW